MSNVLELVKYTDLLQGEKYLPWAMVGIWDFLRPFLWIHLLYTSGSLFGGGIPKFLCLPSILQGHVRCWHFPLAYFPCGGAESQVCVLSSSLRVGPAFCTCPAAVCRDTLTSTVDVHRLPASGLGVRGAWRVAGAHGWVGGICRQGVPSGSWVSFLMESVKQLVGSVPLWCP